MNRVIREGMTEAHQNVDEFGGTWFVLSDSHKSVVTESYFITEDGERKVKPFVCLYNTDDKRYGRHTIQWVDGKIVIDKQDVKERFTQKYGNKIEEMEMIGKPAAGRTLSVPPSYVLSANTYEMLDSSEYIKNEVFDMSTGKMVNSPIGKGLTKNKRLKLRKKRKKRK